MRFRESLKFALELFRPERLAHPGGDAASDPKPVVSRNAETSAENDQAAQIGKARGIIEELDHGKFGGPSFGPQTVELMAIALEGARTSLPEPASHEQLRLLAATILNLAGDGERDPLRLKAAAMSTLAPVAAGADETPPSS